MLEPHADRVTWDAPIHSIADITRWSGRPKAINSKPSRFGSLAELLSTYEYCERQGSRAYGGGQGELGPGRGQIQYLASLFHPDTPNDVAPSRLQRPAPSPTGMPDQPDGARFPRRPVSAGPSRVPRDGREQIRQDPQRAGRQRVRRLAAVHRDRRPLRRRDPPPARLLLLPPGGRGAKPRDDDDPVPARRRPGGRDPGVEKPQADFTDTVAPVKLALEQEKRVSEQIADLVRLAREEGDYRASSSCSGSSRSRSRRSPRWRRC